MVYEKIHVITRYQDGAMLGATAWMASENSKCWSEKEESVGPMKMSKCVIKRTVWLDA